MRACRKWDREGGKPNVALVNDRLALRLENACMPVTSSGGFLWCSGPLCFLLPSLQWCFVWGSHLAPVTSRSILAIVINTLALLLDIGFLMETDNNIWMPLVQPIISTQNIADCINVDLPWSSGAITSSRMCGISPVYVTRPVPVKRILW